MILCSLVFVLSLIFAIVLRKKSAWRKIRSPCRMLLLVSLMGLAVSVSETGGTDAILDGKIKRPLPGEGNQEIEASFYLEGEDTKFPVTLTIEEQTYRCSEEKRLLSEAVKEIRMTFCGENASLEQIFSNPVIKEEYQKGAVLAEWTFSDADLISDNGEICQDALLNGKKKVEAFVRLECGNSEDFYSFSFWVISKAKSKKERAVMEVKEQIALQESTEEAVILPEIICGQNAVWQAETSVEGVQILGLGVLASAAVVYAEKEKEERKRQKRKRSLLLAYPEFVGKLSLLLGAGMTISAALRKMNGMYQKRKEMGGKEEAVYEELGRMVVETDNGMGEIRACQEFAKRCDLQPYRKLVSLLVNGQKAGNKKLMEQLNEEADRVFAERKNAAQKVGEEAGTKMLFPMLLMLLIVMAVILIPAFLSFYGK